MVDFELDDVAEQRKFWMIAVGSLFGSGLIQLFFGEYLLAVTALGSAVTFAVVAHEKLEEEA